MKKPGAVLTIGSEIIIFALTFQHQENKYERTF